MPLPLPRIERQRNDRSAIWHDAVPLDRIARCPQLAERDEHSSLLRFLPTPTCNRGHLMIESLGSLGNRVQQHRMRTQFNEDRHALFDKLGYRIGEENRSA